MTTHDEKHTIDWNDGYETGFAEGWSGRFNPDGSYRAPFVQRVLISKTLNGRAAEIRIDFSDGTAQGYDLTDNPVVVYERPSP